MNSFLGRLLGRKDADGKASEFDSVYAEALRAASARDLARAIAYFDRAIALRADHAEAHYKRANALKDLGHLHAAIAGYDRAIELKTDYAFAYCNRGVVQQQLDLTDEALASFAKAIEFHPADALAHYNRALCHQKRYEWAEALASYDGAIIANPEFADAHYNRAVLHLYCGDFAAGWQEYEWRWKNAQRLSIGAQRNFRQPLWLGEQSIAGKRLLLHSEAGLGDNLQFSRYAPLCAAQGAEVILEAPAPLVEVLGTLQGIKQVIASGDTLPDFDYHCPIMSLPLAFRTTANSVPATTPYLRADPTRVLDWRQHLGPAKRRRIGIAWSGNPRNPIDDRRSFPLAEWLPHLPEEHEYFCVQTEIRDSDRGVLASTPRIRPLGRQLVDFADTAALCECLDLIISVDTSVIHLCGALGRPTWVLLASVPDWRWMRDGDESPWYPGMRLFRQPHAGEWGKPFIRVAEELHKSFGSEATLA